MNKFLSHSLKTLLGIGVTLGSLVIPLNSQQSIVSAQSTTAVVFAPPSNVRSTPNGQILCSVKSVTSINTYGSSNGWYITDVCGRRGYIHHSQIRFETYSESVKNPSCIVSNIRTGQLALRKSPGGESIAGLNNDNLVQYIRGDFPWYYVRVTQGPNRTLNGRTGWVNANYLECLWD